MSTPDASPSAWTLIAQSLARPYRVPASLVVLLLLVPFYIFIPELFPAPVRHAPAIALDALFPLQPVWALVYGALYLFLILLPVFVVRDDEHIRRTVRAYLFVWLVAYVFFIAWPTVAPRPLLVLGDGFAAAGLRFLYEADPPYNCFPSLHVAHSFVSALTCFRLHRRLGVAAIVAASLVALSTLFTKQHYVLDVVSGVALALIAYAVFLRRDSSNSGSRAAPVVAMALFAACVLLVGAAFAVHWFFSAAMA